MDMAEGALLGKYWSDTDFETRRHRGLELIISLTFWGLLLSGAFLMNFRTLPSILGQGPPWLFFFFLLFIATPFLGKVYYRLNVPLRFVVLGALFFKYISLFMAIITAAIPLLHLPEDFSLNSIFMFFEGTIGDYVQTQSENYGATGLLWSVALMILVSGIVVLLGTYIMVQFPVWTYHFVSWVQRTYDEAVDMFIKHRTSTPTRQGEGMKDRITKLLTRTQGRAK